MPRKNMQWLALIVLLAFGVSRLPALLPLLIHRGEPRSALVIGLGTGITAGALTTHSIAC